MPPIPSGLAAKVRRLAQEKNVSIFVGTRRNFGVDDYVITEDATELDELLYQFDPDGVVLRITVTGRIVPDRPPPLQNFH